MGFLDDLSGKDLSTTPSEPEKPPAGGFLENLDQESKAKASIPTPAPDWSEVPARAVTNIPHSAMEFGKAMVHPIMHPIDTMESVGNIALGLMEKAGLYGSTEHIKYPDAVGKMLVDRYGSIDNVKKTLASDPVGFAADASLLLTGGGSALARAPGMVGKVGEVTATAGRAIDPINAAAIAAKTAGRVGTEGVGLLTGTHWRPLEEAAHAGYEGGEALKSLNENMRGHVPLGDVVETARDAIETMRAQRGAEYRAGMTGVGADTTVLNWNKIGQAIRDTMNIHNYKGQELSPKTANVRSELNDTVLEWMALPPKEFHTPEGFDALKKKIGDIRDGTEPHTPARTIANKYYSAVRQSIIDQVPEYAKVMGGYEKATNLVGEIERTLSLGETKGIDTALRKLQSTLRNNVNTNFGHREKLIEYLRDSGAPHIVSALAGQNLNTWTPRGLNRFLAALGLEGAAVHPGSASKVAAVLPLMSPRLMGETFSAAGKLARPLKYIPQKKNVARALFQTGRATTLPEMQEARGGRIDRALRATKRH